MYESHTGTSERPNAEPKRGDVVRYAARRGAEATRTGVVASSCVPTASQRRQLTIRDSSTGARVTRLAASVIVIKPAAADAAEPSRPSGLGHRPGQPAPNARRKLPAEPLTPDEVAAVIGQCSPKSRTGIRNRALLTLLYRSGLRVSEALALKPADVDFAEHTVRVLHGKGDKATVRGFHSSADDALARWLDTRKAMGLRNGPLFCTLDGGPVHAQYVRLLLGRLAAKADVTKRVHPHGLRHTFADELRRKGVDVVTISKLLGHSTIAVTVRYLDHLTNAQAVTALQAVDLPPLRTP